ncbi:MAG: hypothetical protein NUW23_08200 [Firmicutes bacterium]|nr:hypothetical protein [Bacillota bacterium]
MREAVALAVNGGLDRTIVSTDLMLVVLEFLPIPDLKYLAIAAAEELSHQIMKERQQARDWSDRYGTERKLNDLTELVVHWFGQLGGFESAVDYFNDHYREDSGEVKLYTLVRLLFDHYRQPELIVEQIKKTKAQGVCPRRELIELASSIAVSDSPRP